MFLCTYVCLKCVSVQCVCLEQMQLLMTRSPQWLLLSRFWQLTGSRLKSLSRLLAISSSPVRQEALRGRRAPTTRTAPQSRLPASHPTKRTSQEKETLCMRSRVSTARDESYPAQRKDCPCRYWTKLTETKEPEDGLLSGEAVKEIIHDVAQNAIKSERTRSPLSFRSQPSSRQHLSFLCVRHTYFVFLCVNV